MILSTVWVIYLFYRFSILKICHCLIDQTLPPDQRISTVMWDGLKSRLLLAVGYNLFKYDSQKPASWRVTGMEMFWIFLFGLILVTCSNITNPYPLKRFYYINHRILPHETIAWMSMATKLLELWHSIWKVPLEML